MASNNYDDLLESFMNNSAKVYDEDKNDREQRDKIAASLNESKAENRAKKIQRGREIEKELAEKKRKKEKEN